MEKARNLSRMNPGEKLGIVGLPTTLLIDREGREVRRYVGAAQWDKEEFTQLIRKVMDPANGMGDWEVTQALANAMGLGWNYSHPSEVMDEISRLTPSFAGEDPELRYPGPETVSATACDLPIREVPGTTPDGAALHPVSQRLSDSEAQALDRLAARHQRDLPDQIACIGR